MIGAIIGDIVGSRFKYNNCRSKDFEFFTPECWYTGNIVMMLAVTKALTDGTTNHEELADNTIKYMQALGRSYPRPEYGIMLREWIYSEAPTPFCSDSCAPAIWTSPIPLIASKSGEIFALPRVVLKKVIDSYSNSKGATRGALRTDLALYTIQNKAEKGKNYLQLFLNNDAFIKVDFTLDEIRDKNTFSDLHQDNLPIAFEAFLESNDFEDAIRNAVSVGGDSSTIAALAGAFAEAYYKKVPPEMARTALSYLTPELLQIYTDFLKAYNLPDNYL